MKSKLLLIVFIATISLTFNSCSSDDSNGNDEPQETLTEKNYRLINGSWKISLRTIDGINYDLGTCLINNQWTFNSTAKTYSTKDYYTNNNNDCIFDTYNSTFSVNSSTLTMLDGNVGINYEINLLDANTLKISRNTEILTFTKI